MVWLSHITEGSDPDLPESRAQTTCTLCLLQRHTYKNYTTYTLHCCAPFFLQLRHHIHMAHRFSHVTITQIKDRTFCGFRTPELPPRAVNLLPSDTWLYFILTLLQTTRHNLTSPLPSHTQGTLQGSPS